MIELIWSSTLIALLITVAVGLQERLRVIEYLFFSRFPILLAAALLALPIGAATFGSTMLGNVFVLDRFGIGIVAFVSTITAWVVMYSLVLQIQGIPSRHGFGFIRLDRLSQPRGRFGKLLKPVEVAVQRSEAAFERSAIQSSWPRALAFSTLALPIIAYAAVRSQPAAGWRIWPAALLGVLIAWLVRGMAQAVSRGVVRALRPKVERLSGDSPRVSVQVERIIRAAGGGYVNNPELTLGHIGAATMFGLAIALYLAGFVFLHPTRPLGLSETVPPLSLVLMLLILVSWLLSGLAFFFDLYRIPVATTIIVGALWFYWVSDSDHHYEVLTRDSGSTADAADTFLPTDAFQRWRDRHPVSERPMPIVVAVSGGGITASLWTARVLTGLGGDPETGRAFGESIVALSTVSGGSVGAMYFVDRYSERGPPLGEDLLTIGAAAGTSSLGTAVWGVVYPDLWRAVAGWLVRDKTIDRGWAMEQQWRRWLGAGDVSLRDWRVGVREGWRPVHFMNATVTETGDRWVFAPIDLPAPGTDSLSTWSTKNFLQLYDGVDVRVSTAARLSATFPWISPIARPDHHPGVPEDSAFHLADGGYFDNYGVVTAVDYLRDVLPIVASEPGDPKRVMVLQIRVSGAQSGQATAKRGWLFAWLGPPLTMLRVRNSTQIARNDVELQLLTALWQQRGVEVRTAVFDLQGVGPLSWQLSEEESRQINDAWDSAHIGEAKSHVATLLRESMGIAATGGT